MFDTAYIDANGDDSTGLIGSFEQFFATIAGARAKQIVGHALIVRHFSALVAYFDEAGNPQMQDALDYAYKRYQSIRNARNDT